MLSFKSFMCCFFSFMPCTFLFQKLCAYHVLDYKLKGRGYRHGSSPKKSASALLTSDKSWRGGIWKADLCFPLTNRRNLERVGACARHVKRQLFIISYLSKKARPSLAGAWPSNVKLFYFP